MPIAYWVHNLSPFLIQFSDGLGIRYYGLAYLMGFVAAAALLYSYWRAGRSPFGFSSITDLMTYIVIGVLVGGRPGNFLLYQLQSLRADPFILFLQFGGRIASHGGLVGAFGGME